MHSFYFRYRNYYKYAVLIFCALLIFSLSACKKETISKPEETNITTDANINSSKITIGAYFTGDENPLLCRTNYNEQMNLLIYDSLYMINSKFEAEENLAAGYEISDGGYNVTVAVKPNIKFHDGSPLTAHDVSATVQFILNHSGYYSHHLRNVKKAVAIDDYHVRFELFHLTPNLKLQLTFPIVCKKELLDTANFRFNGTGIYRVASETKGKQMTLERNEAYHKEYSTDISEIEVSWIPDKETARSLSGSGILDIFYAAFFDEGLKTVTKYESLKFDYLTDEYSFLALNYNVSLLQEKKFRKALYTAISRDKIRDEIFMSHAECAYLPLPPGSWAYNDSESNQKNTEESKRLLSELGYSDVDNNGIVEIYEDDTKKELVLDLLTANDAIKKDVCEALVNDFKEIGIALKVHSVPLSEFEAVYQQKVHDIYLITTNVGYDLDLAPFFEGVFSVPTEISFTTYQKKLANTDKLELKQPDYMRLCDDFYEYIPHIPLLFLKNTMITGNKLKPVTHLYPSHLYYSILKN